jgi:putative addiction module CopG family antidote
MTISLSAETSKLVQASMRDGGYKSADEVIRAGLESLKQRELLGEFEAGELEELLAEGERGGPSLDGKQVLAELRALRSTKK